MKVQRDLEPEFLERLAASISVSLGLPVGVVERALMDFLEAETSALEAINAVMALGVHKRPGGPDDGADQWDNGGTSEPTNARGT